jgi:uncharacterized protein (DUF427 family)
MRAHVNGITLAESDDTIVVEGNHYFPPSSVRTELFQQAELTTSCPWKGLASYYDIVVDGTTHAAKAWYYPEPKEKAENIRDYVAFYVPPVTVD